jgi:hypothetical protein
MVTEIIKKVECEELTGSAILSVSTIPSYVA